MDDERIVDLLKEILKWTRFQGMISVKGVLLDTLKKDEEKVAYESSEGRGSKEVAKLAGISHQTVVNYWKKWATLGIVEPLKVRGGLRYRRSFSLSDFDIEVPKMKVEEKLKEIAEVGAEEDVEK